MPQLVLLLDPLTQDPPPVIQPPVVQLQTPPWQRSTELQFLHAAPVMPQALLLVAPLMQLPPLVQPEVQTQLLD